MVFQKLSPLSLQKTEELQEDNHIRNAQITIIKSKYGLKGWILIYQDILLIYGEEQHIPVTIH